MSQQQISSWIEDEAQTPVSPQIKVAADALCVKIGEAAVAVLFYGSALRDDDLEGKIVDLYVLVDTYRAAYDSILSAVANAILPPNVYYLSLEEGGHTIRIKYAVISFSDFEKQAAGKAFTPYIWGRFAQPTAVVYARNVGVRDHIVAALSNAVLTLIRKTAPLMTQDFRAVDLWTRALRESYRTELRAEQKSKNQELYAASRERSDHLLEAAADLNLGYCRGAGAETYRPTGSVAGTIAARVLWALRKPIGKTLTVLRLIKAAFTFADGVDYILWKVERHSGVKITPTDWQRRHPLMASVILSWRLYIRGGFR